MEQIKKNSNFVQLYRKNITEIRRLTNHNPMALNIFLFLLEHMDYNNTVACSYSVLEEFTGKSKSTITRAIKTLKDNGFIQVFKMGTSNIYTVHPDVAWTSYDDNNKDQIYAKFNGVMLVSKKENKEYFQMQNKEKIKIIKVQD